MSPFDLSIVLPCYNEAQNLPLVVERFVKLRAQVNFELVLVDNGSTDDSKAVLAKLKAQHDFIKVVDIPQNIGYGHGIYSGLKVAGADILSYSHADIQTPPEDVIKAYKLVKEQGLDFDAVLVKGCRTNRASDKVFLTRALSAVTRLILGVTLEDINGQPKLFSRKFFNKLIKPPLDFAFDVYVMYVADKNKLKLVTLPVDFGERQFGQSKWASSILAKYKTIFNYVKSIVKISKGEQQ